MPGRATLVLDVFDQAPRYEEVADRRRADLTMPDRLEVAEPRQEYGLSVLHSRCCQRRLALPVLVLTAPT